MSSVANPNADLDFSYMTPRYLRQEARRDARQDRKRADLIADAKARGVTGLRCDECGTLHGLGIIGSSCNYDTDGTGTPCGSYDLSEVRSSVKLARPAAAPWVPFTGGAA